MKLRRTKNMCQFCDWWTELPTPSYKPW